MNVLSEEYLSWLADETENEKSLSNFSMNKEDKRLYLEDLFEAIDAYCKKFYYFDVKEYGYTYNFQYNGIYYEIVKIYGPDVFYRVIRTNKVENAIDLKHVMTNMLAGEKNITVNTSMKAIGRNLEILSKQGVSMDIVERETHSMILRLKNVKNTK